MSDAENSGGVSMGDLTEEKSVNTGGGAYVGGNIKAGVDFVGGDKVMTEISSSQSTTVQDFLAIFERLRSKLQETNLEGIVNTVVTEEIANIEKEAQDEEPSLPIIEVKLTSLKNLIEKAGGVVMATTGLTQVIQLAIGMAQELFP